MREIAASVGSSHRMLIYHFGSREGMLEAVVTEIASRSRRRDAELFPLNGRDGLRARWEHVRDKDNYDAERLFFELAALAIRQPGTLERFRADLSEPWLELSAKSVEELPVDATRARVVTRLDLAVLRGLLMDLLVTDDAAEIDEAFEAYARLRRRMIDEAIDAIAEHR